MKTILFFALGTLLVGCAAASPGDPSEDDSSSHTALAAEDDCEARATQQYIAKFNGCKTANKVDFECQDRAANDYGNQILACQNTRLLLNGCCD